MRCAFCGGEEREELVTFSYDEGGRFFMVEDVPARVCARCGERTYSVEVTDQLMRIARNEFAPRRMIQIPVFGFASRG